MAFYELVYIVRPDVSSNQTEQSAKKFEEVITSKGGKIIKTEQWGLKTLAYRVNKHRKGYYTMIGFEGTGEIVAEVERQMRISDDIIRFLSIRVEELTKAPSIQMAPRRRGDESSDSPRTKRPMANTASA
jgi:small subunit ribosomal protein S6